MLTTTVTAAACGGGDLDVEQALEDWAEGVERSVEPAEQEALLEPVRSGLDELLAGPGLEAADGTGPTTAEPTEARAAFQALNQAVGTAIVESSDPASILAAIDDEVLAAYDGPASTDAAAAIDQALAGQAIDVGYTEPKRAGAGLSPSDPVRDPRLKVYFVNGINNTLDFARGTTAQLVQSLGHDVTHFYNPSAFDPPQYTEDWCARSITALFAEQRQSLLLSQLQADDEAADAIARAAESGSLAWFYEAVTRSLDGVSRDMNTAAANAGLTAAEWAMGEACQEVDYVKNELQHSLDYSRFLLDWYLNTLEVVEHRILAAFDDPSMFDAELVELIKADISQGRRVVIVSHSHGTMLARFALQEINRWYAEELVGDCPSGSEVDPRAVAPVAALYVSPGFGVDADAQQAAVMVEGDFLSLIGHSATVGASGSQLDLGPIDRHDMRRYLEPGTASLAHIQGAFIRLATHVNGVPDPADACDGDLDDPTGGDDTAAEPTPSTDPTWVLVDTAVNPDGSEPHPYWTDVEVAPGAVSWVWYDGDPTFGAVYDVAYDLPPEQLIPGERYEVPVSVSGLITTGESQRFTGADVILYMNRNWDGAVSVAQSCAHYDGALHCDEPAVNSGTLPYTAPTSGESFEFAVALLNCGACEVVFRYELR